MYQRFRSKKTYAFFYSIEYGYFTVIFFGNFNGLVRQYYEKKSSFEMTEEELAEKENELNNRPRKIHGFVPPINFLQLISKAPSNMGEIAEFMQSYRYI